MFIHKNRIGCLFIIFGSISLLVSIFFDYLSRQPHIFGLNQVFFAITSMLVICVGIFLIYKPSLLKIYQTRIHRIITINNSITNVIILILIILLSIYPIKFIYNYYLFPFPLEYRDAAVVSTSVAFSKGINPYFQENFPENMYLYGIFAPLFLSTFINSTKSPIVASRTVDVFFLILLLILSFLILRKRRASVNSSLIGVLILLNSFCLIFKINGSRPDASGLFFSLLGCSIFLLKEKPNNTLVILSAFLVTISFFFKQYMIFSVPIVVIYLFFFISKKKGLIFITSVALIGISSFLLIRKFFPLYFEYSIIHHFNRIEGRNTSHMIKQSVMFIKYYWILCIIYFYHLYNNLSKFSPGQIKVILKRDSYFEEAVLQGYDTDMLDIGIIVTMIFLTFSLGKHIGNYYIYYGELLLPLLIYLTVPKINLLFNSNSIIFILQVTILAVCVYPFHINYQINFSSYRIAFENLYEYASQCKNIYDQTPLIALYKIEHNMFPIYNNGQNEFSVIPEKGTLLNKFATLPAESQEDRLLERNNEIEEKINLKEFDCIFTESKDDIPNYRQYVNVEEVLGRTVYIFTPIKP